MRFVEKVITAKVGDFVGGVEIVCAVGGNSFLSEESRMPYETSEVGAI